MRYDASSGFSETLYGLHGLSDSEVWAVGSFGALYRYDGTSWTGLPTGISPNLYAVWAPSSDIGRAVGLGGTILRFEASDR